MSFSRYAGPLVNLFAAVVLVFTTSLHAEQSTPSLSKAASSTAAAAKKINSVEGINEYVLPNGLHVLMLQDASKPTTTVNLTVKVGSRMENYGETGMAHLLEHLMFKGTPTTRDPTKEFTRRGLRYNGSTSFDRTNYFASFSQNDANLDFYVNWVADALVNSFIARKDLDSEMTVVRNEMESRENNPGGILYQKLLAVAYDWHNYAKLPIGARSDVENVDIPRLQAFYHKYYQPDNAVLIVTGKFDEAKTLAIVAKAFGKIPKPKRVIEPTYTLEPVQEGERSVVLRRVGDTPVIMVGYHVPATAAADYQAVELMTLILGGPNLRLHKALVEGKLAADIFGETLDTAEPGMTLFGAELSSSQSVDSAREALLKTVEGAAAQPFTQEELDRARNIWLREFDQTFSDPQRVGVALSEYVAIGDWRLAFLGRDRINAMTLADVNQAATRYLLASNRTLATFLPTPEPLRAPALERVDAAAMLKDFKGTVAMAQGEAFDVSPENINKRTLISKEANIQYALLEKRTRGQKLSLRISLHFGDEKSLFNKTTVGQYAAAMLSRGTQRLTREQLAAEFEKLQATWSVGGGASGITFSLEVDRDHLQPALALAAEVLRQPRFDAAEFEQLRTQSITELEGRRSEPQALLGERMARHGNPYPKGDVRYTPTLDESLADTRIVTLDDAKNFYAGFFGTSDAIVSAVGDFDANALKQQIGMLLADWKSPAAYVRVPNPYVDVQPTRIKIEVKDKQNAIMLVEVATTLREEDREFQALRLATHIFGEASGRLWNRIREQQGLSYGVGANTSGGQFNAHGEWNAYAIFAPQNADAVQTAFDQELARALKEGFTAEELTRSKDSIRSSTQLARAQDRTLSGALVNLVERNKTPLYWGEIQTMRDSITLDEVNAAFRKYVVPGKLVVGMAGDFAGATKSVTAVAPAAAK